MKSSFVALVGASVRVGKELMVPAGMTMEAGKAFTGFQWEDQWDLVKKCHGLSTNVSGSLKRKLPLESRLGHQRLLFCQTS